MSDEVRFIKFMRCPIDFHRGERWSKLSMIDPGEPFKLVAVKFGWSDDFYTEGINFEDFNYCATAKIDTFPDITLAVWRELMNYWYEDNNIFGIVLLFKQERGTDAVLFTTFRSYSARSAKFYTNSIGLDFMLKEVV